MKRIKSFKLFEAYHEDTKFYRFSQVELAEGDFSPKKRVMWGPDDFNNSLVKIGFPDKRNCVHFMDEVAFNPEYKGLYGKNIYQVVVDDSSNLGWSFVIPINDWFYKGSTFYQAQRMGNGLIQSLMETPYKDLSFDDVDEISHYLIDFGAIGCGTIDDLKRSPHWGKEKLFIWTSDTIKITKWEAPEKPQKVGEYKTDRVLLTSDFTDRGLLPKDIGRFYSHDLGKSVKGLSREEALQVLDKWISEG